MLRNNEMIFISPTAHNNARYINEVLVILSVVKRTMMHYLSVYRVLLQDREINEYYILTACPVTVHDTDKYALLFFYVSGIVMRSSRDKNDHITSQH